MAYIFIYKKHIFHLTSNTKVCYDTTYSPKEVDKLKEMATLREHKHIIVRAYVNNPPQNADRLSDWCKEVVADVGMKVIAGPLVVYGDMPGNAGYTAVTVLDFSHLAIHSWDEVSPGLIEFDLFSCLDFNPQIVIDKIHQEYDIVKYSFMTIDRDNFDKNMIGVQ